MHKFNITYKDYKGICLVYVICWLWNLQRSTVLLKSLNIINTAILDLKMYSSQCAGAKP